MGITKIHSGSKSRTTLNFIGAVFALLCLSGVAGNRAQAQEGMTEYQVKALCLYNFAKYVDWPAAAAPAAGAPVTITVLDNEQFARVLTGAIAGKSISGHPIVVQVSRGDDGVPEGQILFISNNLNKQAAPILEKIRSKHVLTVGEGAAFTESGGMIAFVLRNGTVRFDVNLGAAMDAGLHISSKLLTLADTVRGKSK